MSTQPMIEQLIDAHLAFLEQEWSQATTVQNECNSFYQWLSQQSLGQLWSFEQINALLQQQILNTPASAALIEQIAEHLHFALVHPVNDSTRIEDVIPVLTVDRIAQYVSSKGAHRQRLIKRVVNNPAFSAMISQLIQHAIQDYMENSMLAKRVPGVSQFMKMGKSMLESVTDADLQSTIAFYLQRNILKLSQLSEHVLNQHFDQDKLYHFQANLWHKIKGMPLHVLRDYIEVKDLPQTVGLAHEIWEHLRQTDYMRQQLHDGLYTWYVRNQERRLDALLRDLNIDEALVQRELQQLLHPVLEQMISSQYLRTRARHYLEKFYYSAAAQQILSSQPAAH